MQAFLSSLLSRKFLVVIASVVSTFGLVLKDVLPPDSKGYAIVAALVAVSVWVLGQSHVDAKQVLADAMADKPANPTPPQP